MPIRPRDALRQRFEKLRQELAAEIAKRDRDRERLHDLWTQLLRFRNAGRSRGKRCCVVCRAVRDARGDLSPHEDGCALAVALQDVEHAVFEEIIGRRIEFRHVPLKLRPETVARALDLDTRARDSLLDFAERWESRDDLQGAYVAIGSIASLIEMDLRARSRRRRAEARRRRRGLLAELVLLGALIESKAPQGVTPEQWTKLVKAGAVPQA